MELPPETFQLRFPDFVAATCDWLDGFEWSSGVDPMFHFVRAIKSHAHTKNMDAEAAYAATLRIIAHNDLVVPEINIADDDSEVAFHSCWERVRFLMGEDPVTIACALAGTGMIKTAKKRPGKYPRFLTVAALLQVQMPRRPILLPVRTIAAHFPCEPNSVTAWTKWALEDGVLVKTKDHAFRSEGGSRAAEYVCAIHKLPTILGDLQRMLGVSLTQDDIYWAQEQFDITPGQRKNASS